MNADLVMKFKTGDLAFTNHKDGVHVWNHYDLIPCNSPRLIDTLRLRACVIVLGIHLTANGEPYAYVVGELCGWIWVPHLDSLEQVVNCIHVRF